MTHIEVSTAGTIAAPPGPTAEVADAARVVQRVEAASESWPTATYLCRDVRGSEDQSAKTCCHVRGARSATE